MKAKMTFCALCLAACLLCLGGENLRRTPVVEAVAKAMPCVVSIGTEIDVRENDPYFSRRNDFFTMFFRQRNIRTVKEYTPLGSGIIVHVDGLVLTNWHVVRGADTLILRLFNNETYPATVIGYDASSDLCLLKLGGDLAGKSLKPAHLSQADDLLLGETVITLGNPFGLEHSVSQGVLSAVNRSLGSGNEGYSDILQTDAAINPGNSGGPLINLDGDVIGINQAMRSDAQGIGFAIPAKRLEQFLCHWLTPESFSDSVLGLACQYDAQGKIRLQVQGNSPAEKAGLKTGDLLAKLDGKVIGRSLDFHLEAWKWRHGDTVKLETADGRTCSLVLGRMSDAELIGRRLGLSLQKLTRSINIALELPEDLEGLAINEVSQEKEFAQGEVQWKKYLKRGDLLLYAGSQRITNVEGLAQILRKSASGHILPVIFAVQVRGGNYYKKQENIILQ